MCESQIVQREDHASFSVLGLTIILCSGLLAFIVSSFLSDIWPRLFHKTFADCYRNEQWRALDLLQLRAVGRSIQSLGEGAQSIEVPSSSRQMSQEFSSQTSSRGKRLKRCEQRDGYMGSTTATIETSIQQNDFPPEELAQLTLPTA